MSAGTADPAATQLLSMGRMNDALLALNSHGDAESLNQLSRVYYAMEQWDEAVKYGERAVQLDSGDAMYHLWLAREYGRKAADSSPFAAAGLARKAKNEFERAVQLDPTNIPARVDLAEYYTEAPAIMGGGLDKARAQAAQVQKLDPGMAHLILARVAVKEKQYDEAETEFRAAVKRRQQSGRHVAAAGGVLSPARALDEMQTAVQSAMAQPNKPADSYFDAGKELYLGGRNFSSAAQYLQTLPGVGRAGRVGAGFSRPLPDRRAQREDGEQCSRRFRVSRLAGFSFWVRAGKESSQPRTVMPSRC